MKKPALNTVLCIADDADTITSVKRLLDGAKLPFELEWCRTFDTACQAFATGQHALILLDERIDGHGGLDLLIDAREAGCDTAVFLLIPRQSDVSVFRHALPFARALPLDLEPQFFRVVLEQALELSRLQEQLKRQAAIGAATLESHPGSSYVVDAEGRHLSLNEAHAERLGLSDPRDAIGRTIDEFLSEEEARPYLSRQEWVRQTGKPLVDRPNEPRDPSSLERPTVTSGYPIADLGGEVCAILFVSREAEDVSEPTVRDETAELRSPTASAKLSLRILLAEDSIFNQRLAAAVLEKHGHEIVIAENGLEALEHFDESLFDLALMDVRMPEMDGFTATREIRKRESGSDGRLPIIALTASESNSGECLAAGMDGYLRKPVRATDLMAMIAEVLERTHGSRGVEERVCQEETTSCEDSELDWQVALERIDGRRNLMCELIELFFQEYPQLMSDIEQALRERSSENLAIYAHRLKGCLRYFGESSAVQIAKAMEDDGRNGELQNAAARQQDLVEAVERILPALRQFVADEGPPS